MYEKLLASEEIFIDERLEGGLKIVTVSDFFFFLCDEGFCFFRKTRNDIVNDTLMVVKMMVAVILLKSIKFYIHGKMHIKFFISTIIG